MRIRDFNDKIIIKAKTATRSTNTGARSYTLSPFVTLSCKVEFKSAGRGKKEGFEGDVSAVFSEVSFTIHYREDITEAHVVEYRGSDYDIVSITHETREKFTALRCLKN